MGYEFLKKLWFNLCGNIFDFKLMIFDQMGFWYMWFVIEVWNWDEIEYLLKFIYFIICEFL